MIRDWEGDERDDLVVLGFLRYHGPRDEGCGWVGKWRIESVGESRCASRV